MPCRARCRSDATYLAVTVTCPIARLHRRHLAASPSPTRWTPYVERCISGPMAPIVKILFAYFFLGQGHDSLKCSDRYLEKNLGKNFPPGGPTLKIFGEVTIAPLRQSACKFSSQHLQNCGLPTCVNIRKNVILAPLRLYPRAQGSPAPKFFLRIFSWVRAMTPWNFQIEISKKNWETIFPQGVRPPNFLEKWLYPP